MSTLSYHPALFPLVPNPVSSPHPMVRWSTTASTSTSITITNTTTNPRPSPAAAPFHFFLILGVKGPKRSFSTCCGKVSPCSGILYDCSFQQRLSALPEAILVVPSQLDGNFYSLPAFLLLQNCPFYFFQIFLLSKHCSSNKSALT